MLKKSLFLVLALLVVGLVLVSAQSAADVQAMEQLTKDLQAGKITPAEFERRINELINKAGAQGYEEDTQQIQQQRQQQPQGQDHSTQRYSKTYPGATAGWPAASAFRRYGKTVSQPNIQTPRGITYSHKTEGEKLIIYVFKNFGNDDLWHVHFDDTEVLALVNQFQRAFGVELSGYFHGDDEFSIRDPSKTYTTPVYGKTVTNYYIVAKFTPKMTGVIMVPGLGGGSIPTEEGYVIIEIYPEQRQESGAF